MKTVMIKVTAYVRNKTEYYKLFRSINRTAKKFPGWRNTAGFSEWKHPNANKTTLEAFDD
jgi:antibiotic biosynthesis monooxygenase (ABM) superfamily enzyme